MSYDSHDIAVMFRVNKHIRNVNKEHSEKTVAKKLECAWSANIKERENDSTNTIGRDADYYFAARKEMATANNVISKTIYAVLGEVAWPVYAIGKIGAESVGHPEWTRTDPDKPNAPVGGFVWMNRGIADAYSDVGDKVLSLKLHSIL